ncbi:TPA: ubiquinol-cytochrome C chaperone family protein [Raoultella planticola]|uniref:ubiquinol-cytochrome C chaperone family protein n=1 Tax=Raoultella planticola TaxID=575 RepID=UPI00292BD02B|nr:ubiquinol-cytochrome C chaperone family protein [Raoultella planticola]MDV1191521.1 ubiquinol-cytochrome C chaperone family protein [Raoultella planticola]WPJ17577.1 ubiquinol-cytochrome C chaperone family protein [Raoultella planticola]
MSEIDIQGDDALVQLLLNADKGDIDLLIDYVTNTGKFGFSMSDNVKAVLQDAKRQDIPDEETLRLLVRELQHFGGNTFVNLFRRNGVNYSEIVDDVASHLKMKVQATASVEEKEALIIDCVFTSSWKKMSDDERSQILRDMGINDSASMDIPVWQRAALVANSLAQTTAGKVLPLIAGLGIGRVLGVLTGPVGLAITGLYTAYDISNPAFRVTLPCVVQIAWIRLKNSRQFRLDTRSSPATMPALTYDQRWGFGHDIHQPALTVATIPPSESINTGAMQEQDVTGISRLSPLLQTLPSLATSAHVASHQYMEVIINGPLASVKDGPGFRGFNLGEKGIKEHAVLLSPDKLSQLVNAGMLLNVASAVLAQKHLADISKKLTEIVEAVREVSAFQNNARKSEIIGAIQYLQQITPVVIEEQCSPAIRQKLEDIEVQFSALQAHLLTDITAAGDKVAALKDRGLFGSTEITNKIRTQQKILDERIHEWDLAMKVRAQALHLLTHAEGNTTLVRHRQQTIVHNYQEFESVVDKVERQVHQRIQGISALTEQSNTTNANKVLLRKWTTTTLMQQKMAIEEAHSSFGKFQQGLLTEQPQSARLLVEMQDGKPVKCFELPAV